MNKKLQIFGAGDQNRTDVASLEGWSFTTKLHPHTKTSGGERRIRTFERITRADLQSAAFGHLAISPKRMP